MKPIVKEKIEEMIRFLKENGNHLVIDADVHITDVVALTGDLKKKYKSSQNYYHGRPVSTEDLLKEMKMAGVDMSLIWQNPSGTVYNDDDADGNFERLLAANRYILHSFLEYPTQFIPAGWTDPKALGITNAIKLIHALMKDFGFFIVKMNPAQNAYPLHSEDVIKCVDEIISLGGIPAFHYGADTIYTPPEDLEKIAELYPDAPVLAVHMGGGGAGNLQGEETYIKTRALGLRRPNLKFILSAKREAHIESDLITYQMAGKPFKNNIFCGSDAPFGRQSWNFGGYARMFESLLNGANHTDSRLQENPNLFTKEDVNNYMGGNFAHFVIEWYERFLVAN